ncbi:hypothetical protein BH09VER1_BH09VER1_28120 [soil metagenome]
MGVRRNHATTAAFNRWQTLALLSQAQCFSQRQLAKATGLRTSTMSNIIRDLKGLGLIRDSGPLENNRVGPKEGGLEIDPDATWAIGLQLDPTGHEIGLVNAAGHVIARRRLPPGRNWREVLESVPTVSSELAAIARANPAACAGLGVSVSGIVDSARGVVLYSRALGIQNENLVALGEKLGVGPVMIERDVNCGLYAEHQAGSGRPYQTFLYYLVRPGFAEPYNFGLGLMLNGRIFHGLSSASGELDPLLAPDFPTESESGAGYDRFYRDCGVRLASLVNVLDIGYVVIAGDDPQFTEERLEFLREEMGRLLLPVPDRRLQISRAQLGEAGILQGAALLAVTRHFRGLLF